jgi:4-carboxymuconolactone decarboxylase
MLTAPRLGERHEHPTSGNDLGGSSPADLTNEEGIGYDMATALLGGGVLASPIWDSALALFGQQGAREIVYLVGHYCIISMTLNGFAIWVPDDD